VIATRLCDGAADPRQRLAHEGEREAEALLRRAGMTILDRRYRRRFGEIDLVARHGDLLVFVEVKTRSGRGYGGPAAAVTRHKQRRIARVALGYLQERGWLERRCRFDVVEVLLRPGGGLRIRHIPDAFRLWGTG
jgi:putative endonuclease